MMAYDSGQAEWMGCRTEDELIRHELIIECRAEWSWPDCLHAGVSLVLLPEALICKVESGSEEGIVLTCVCFNQSSK